MSAKVEVLPRVCPKEFTWGPGGGQNSHAVRMAVLPPPPHVTLFGYTGRPVFFIDREEMPQWNGVSLWIFKD